MLHEARYFVRMMAGCRRFIRTPRASDPRSLIAANLARREQNFLDLMRRVVFAQPRNPLHRLFLSAGCGFEDLKSAVERDGLEPTLSNLHTAGVRLSHDEFKGKQPIQRSGLTINVQPRDFANPFVRGALETTSSGSRSRGTVTRHSAGFQAYREAQDALFVGQFEPAQRAIVAVLPVLPSTVGFYRMLTFQRRGTPVEKWFSLGGSWRGSGHYHLLTRLLVAEARLLGLKIPSPTYISERDFSPVARWIAARRAAGTPVLWMGPVSMGVLTASAARESALDIRGTTFLCGAEPLTEARREVIESAGGEVYPRYGISELGWIGCSCLQMRGRNAVHVMRDSVAVVSHRRRAPMAETDVESLLFTTLLPSSTYVLVNVEMEDAGSLGPARCDCQFKAMGFTQEIAGVYSYGKLTGQGITLLGGELLSVLERSLPSRFGGTPADYQLVELDGQHGAIAELRVHPRLDIRSLDAVRDHFLAEVRRLWGGSLTARQWGQTGAVRVVLAEPIISGGRKINSLHLLGTSRRPGSSA